MNEPPEQELLEAVATELAVAPSFVEKDWHATQIIARIAERSNSELALVFSGGTSLSKGFGLIQRFSEDIDFKLLHPGSGIDRDARRNYRASVIDAIRSAETWTLSKDDILVADRGRFLRCVVAYSPIYTPSEPLRPYIRLEMTLTAPALPPERRPLQSLVAGHSRILRKSPQFIALRRRKPLPTNSAPSLGGFCRSITERTKTRLSCGTFTT